MQINLIAVVVCGLVSIILGCLWYGPLFGRAWMRVMARGSDSKLAELNANPKLAHKEIIPLYLIQLVLSLVQVWMLANFWALSQWAGGTILKISLCIWFGFIVPIIASASLWGGDTREIAWKRFLIQAGYQLVYLVMAALIIGAWTSV